LNELVVTELPSLVIFTGLPFHGEDVTTVNTTVRLAVVAKVTPLIDVDGDFLTAVDRDVVGQMSIDVSPLLQADQARAKLH
jgi:hypothetical protein